VFGRREIKSILPLVRFRTTDPRHLDCIPEETRVLIRTLEIKTDCRWNTDNKRDGYDMACNPVGRRPPAWFSPTHMSLNGTTLPGLKKLHVRVEFDMGYFIAIYHPEKRLFYAAETAQRLEEKPGRLERRRRDCRGMQPLATDLEALRRGNGKIWVSLTPASVR
jgi:hypothetical protein